MNYQTAFFQADRIGADPVDATQREIANSKTTSYELAAFRNGHNDRQTIEFASSVPTMAFSGMVAGTGSGVGPETVDAASQLAFGDVQQTRELEKLCLQTRPFVSIPYLGRGSCDPTVESRLWQGELGKDKKSVDTIMTQSFMDYRLPPKDTERPLGPIEEAALDGFVRGGMRTRQMLEDEHYASQSRPQDRM